MRSMSTNPPLPTNRTSGRPDPITLTAAVLAVASLVMAHVLRDAATQAPRMTVGVMVAFCFAPVSLARARAARVHRARLIWGRVAVGAGLIVTVRGVSVARKNDSLQLLRYDFPVHQVVTLAALNLAPVALAGVGIALVLGGAAHLSGDRVVAAVATIYTALAALVYAAALAAVAAMSLPYRGGSLEPKFLIGGALVALAALLFPVVAIRPVAIRPASQDSRIEDARTERSRPTRLLVVVTAVALVAAVSFWGYGRFANRQTVADLFADPALAACVTTGLQLNDAKDATSQVKLNSVTTLDCNPNQATANGLIHALAGLEHLPHLSTLDLTGNQISDLTPLGQVPTLMSLKLTHNQVSDVSPLGALVNLQDLGLSDNQIQDVGNLGNLTQLRTLGLSGNRVVETGPLGHLVALTELDLSRNRLTDVHALDGLTGDPTLTELDLSDNGVTSVHSLTGLTALTHLTLRDNQIKDLSPLSALPALSMLNVAGNQVRTAAALTKLPMVDELWLGGNPITNLTPLRRMPALRGVDLEGDDPAKLRGIQKLTDKGIYVGGMA